MSLRHVYLPLKDVNLRYDVGVLGNLVGEIIQDGSGVLCVYSPKVFVARKWELKRCAFDVLCEDEQVIGLDSCMLGRLAEEVIRVLDNKLVQWI